MFLKCVEVHFISCRSSVGFDSTVEQEHWLKEEKRITINATLSCFSFHCLMSVPRLLPPLSGQSLNARHLSLFKTINM